ncbi:hypothetical protein B0H16DRAFT_1741305 [Mycena metata]|uniref:CxC2-like cysteine cluster KDZ transposase-associated domain-containing protein n=1 Tax=Mycena metata TaxID=1033252 RepID=A0AAD7MGJ3_9AGAR|nr:hypothetical protein B0H16DRAFT_1741305 [Mycena metata]
MARKRKHTHYDIPEDDESGDDNPASSSAPRRTANMLRETTRVTEDGRLHQTSRFVPVPASPQKRSTRQEFTEFLADSEPLDSGVHDSGPQFEREGGLDSDVDDDDGPRELRDSDDPLGQWVRENRAEFLQILLLLEGRGDHRYSLCPTCSREPDATPGKAEYRCRDCLAGGQLVCKNCLVEQHQKLPLHRVQVWTGIFFQKILLKSLGLRIQLGHWNGRRRCLLPERAAGDDFVIVHDHGVHKVGLDFCGCGRGGQRALQLLHAGLFPSTIINPRSAATFEVLDRFELLSYESKSSTFEFYHSLARETNNTGVKESETESTPASDRYHEFRRMTREWSNLHMLKRAGCGHDPGGIGATKPGGCALLCPACPHPGKNLPADWKEQENRQFLYALFLAMDANFRLKRKDVSTEEKDPGLGDGLSFYCEVKRYMAHVAAHWDTPQERSTCVAHDAVDKPDREARGTVSSGVGAVDCARHNMKRPLAVGDLQYGERYINIDYMFFRSIAGTELVRFFVSYDIACQWHINIWTRMNSYEREIRIVDDTTFLVFLVPKFHLPAHIEACNIKFSFNLTRHVGQTDGEAPERGWANANPLAGSTREMGPGARRDKLNEHFNDLNWKKTIGLGRALEKKMRKAVPEMVAATRAFEDMERSLRAAGEAGEGEVETVEVWTKMATEWEKDATNPNPFETLRKDDHLAKVRRDLAEEAAARAAEGDEDEGDVVDEMHVTEMIAMGLKLEEHQRTLGFDMGAMGQHPTDDQCRTMVERTSKLRRKIEAWVWHQERFTPRVIALRKREDTARARAARTQVVPGVKVQDLRLWLPSAIMKTPGAKGHKDCPSEEIQRYEFRLRVGQAHEALHEIRRQLIVRTHLYKHKDKQSFGVRANMRSRDKIDVVEERIRRVVAGYRTARAAIVSLAKSLNETGWEITLKELKEEDVRARPRSTMGDPERQKATRSAGSKAKKKTRDRARKELPLSWIWVSQTKGAVAGEKQEMNEALRIEWAKTRARSLRWTEEVDLLEEEMRRVLQFFTWRAGWWEEQIGRRDLPDGAHSEGETAYAARQAALLIELRDTFAQQWSGLAELVQRGRADEDVTDWEWVDDDGGSDGEEDDEEIAFAPVPGSGRRVVNPTYVEV